MSSNESSIVAKICIVSSLEKKSPEDRKCLSILNMDNIFPIFSNRELIVRQLCNEFELTENMIIVHSISLEEMKIVVSTFKHDVENIEIPKLEKFKTKIEKIYPNVTDLILFMIYYNKYFRASSNPRNKFIYFEDTSQEKHSEIYGNYFSIFDLLKIEEKDIDKLKTLVNRLKDQIKNNKTIIKSDINIIKKISDINIKKVDSTDLVITKNILETEIDFFLKVDIKDIYGLYNKFILSNRIPFSKIDKFYKILKGTIPNKDWSKLVEDDESDLPTDILYLKIYNKKYIPESLVLKDKLFSTVRLYQVESKLVIRVDRMSWNELTSEEMIKMVVEKIEKLFNKTFEMSPFKQSGIEAEFQIPKMVLNEVIIRHMCMLDDYFSYFLSIDERHQAYKTKSNLYLHFKFNQYDTWNGKPSIFGSVVANISEDTVKLSNHVLQQKGYQTGTQFLNLSIIRSGNEEIAKRFKEAIIRLLTYYSDIDLQKSIEKLYINWIPNFEELYSVELKEEEEKENLDKSRLGFLGHIYIPGFARFIQLPRQPAVVSEEEAKKLDDNRWMKFPSNSKETPRYYACIGNKKFQYIGVDENVLENKDVYPYLPSCFEKDQTNKKMAIYQEFLSTGVKPQKIEKDKKGRFIGTDKILNKNVAGQLPRNILEFLLVIDPVKTNHWIRFGVGPSPSSIIKVLEYAKKKEHVSQDRIDIIRKQIMVRLKERKNSTKYVKIWQEAYNKTPMEIGDLLNDEKEFLNVKIFLKELEDIFNCRIFIFERNLENPKGFLSCPHFVQRYYSLQDEYKDKKCVFIYQHMGSEFDKAEYPQCEIIIKVPKENYEKPEKDEMKCLFSPKSKIIQRIAKHYEEMYKDLSLDNIKVDLKSTIIGQGVDIYGKTRYLELQLKDGKTITIHTDPLPSFPVKRVFSYFPVSKKILDSFIKEEEISEDDLEWKIVNEKKVGVSGRKFGVSFYIPVKPIKTEEKEESSKLISSPTFIDNFSQLEVYNEMKRNARYLTEYFLYGFSLFLSNYEYKKKTTKHSDILIAELLNSNSETVNKIESFIEEKCIIDPDVKYNTKEDFPREYKLDSKLRIEDKDTLSRLIYILRLELKNNPETIIEYSKLPYIRNYYKDPSDFDESKDHLIILGDVQYDRWISSQKMDYNGSNTIEFISIPDKILTDAKKDLEAEMKEEKKKDNKFISRKVNKIVLLKHMESPLRIFSIRGKKYILQPVPELMYIPYVINEWKTKKINIGSIRMNIEFPLEKSKSFIKAPENIESYIECFETWRTLMDIPQRSGEVKSEIDRLFVLLKKDIPEERKKIELFEYGGNIIETSESGSIIRHDDTIVNIPVDFIAINPEKDTGIYYTYKKHVDVKDKFYFALLDLDLV